MNDIVPCLIEDFASFLRVKFSNVGSLGNLAALYCFLLLRNLQGDGSLLRSLLLGKGPNMPSDSLLVKIFLPQGPRDLIFKTIVMFRALTNISLVELDGVLRVITFKMAALGFRVYPEQTMLLDKTSGNNGSEEVLIDEEHSID